MLFFFFISCFSCIIFYKSLPLKPLPNWACEMRLISPLFWKDLSLLAITKIVVKNSSLLTTFVSIPLKMSFKNKPFCSQVMNFDDGDDDHHHSSSKIDLLDLPELVLECILERLPPEGLCSMASVCSSLRERCMSDHLWEKHLKLKWGGVIGPAAYREWQCHIGSRKDPNFFNQAKEQGLMNYLANLWPISLVRSNFGNGIKKKNNLLPIDSIMSWYLALESGNFWFPAQVYNRENGHVGFMLSCYDAELCYDPKTDTFRARYPPHGRRAVAIETGVTWDRLRAPPVDTSPHDLHVSDCLDELRPGDHIEIQWRRNKEFPYGWWYGIVGHLENCDGNDNYCSCHESDTVVLEFNQYSRGSRWRRTTISRKDHCEEGDEAAGFYGGIRKIISSEEISTWKELWPAEVLE